MESRRLIVLLLPSMMTGCWFRGDELAALKDGDSDARSDTAADTGETDLNDTGDTDPNDTGDTDSGGDTSDSAGGGDSGADLPVDADGDHYPSDVDCDDMNTAVHPGAADTTCDGIDNDCDGVGPAGCGREGVYDAEELEAARLVSRYDYLGTSVTVVDLDGDGSNEIVAGATEFDGDANRTGGVGVFRTPLAPGNHTMSDAVGTWGGEVTGDRAGYYVDTGGDLNGDGYVDLVIGAFLSADGGDQSGKVYLVSGLPRPGDRLVDGFASIIGPPQGMIGTMVASVGDLNGDSVDDVVVSAATFGGARVSAGIFLGPLSGEAFLDDAAFTMSPPGAGDSSSAAAARIGDADGDGMGDWLMTTNGYFTGGRVVWAWSGVPASASYEDADASWSLYGDAATYNAGVYSSYRRGGDVDGDGYDDFVVQQGRMTGAWEVPPRVFVIAGPLPMGSVSLSASRAIVEAPLSLGYMSVDGDLDADGRADLVVASDHTGGETANAAMVWYGPVSGSLDPLDAPLIVRAPDGTVAREIRANGDVTGDGVSDLLFTWTTPYGDMASGIVAGTGF